MTLLKITVNTCAAGMLVSLPLTAISANPVKAQSFSCANAQIPTEMAICNNENLLIKDEQVAELLASALVTATQTGKVQKVSSEHSQWLQDRNQCSNDFNCLEQLYNQRIKNLTGRDL
jgi:uncharacterized protein